MRVAWIRPLPSLGQPVDLDDRAAPDVDREADPVSWLQIREQRGWIDADWGISENNRKAKFYRLTTAGRKQLKLEMESWQRISAAINFILGTATV